MFLQHVPVIIGESREIVTRQEPLPSFQTKILKELTGLGDQRSFINHEQWDELISD